MSARACLALLLATLGCQPTAAAPDTPAKPREIQCERIGEVELPLRDSALTRCYVEGRTCYVIGATAGEASISCTLP